MTESDRERFALAVNAMAATFRQEPTRAMLHGYWLGLRDLPVEAVEKAVEAGIRNCRFMPAVAELREYAGGPKPEDCAQLAWAAFERAVVTHGGYRSVVFDDAIIHAVVRSLGGWERCCELAPEEFDKWLRKDFLATYASFARTGVVPAVAASLPGIFDRENAIHGHAPQEVQWIETGLAGLAGRRVTHERTKALEPQTQLLAGIGKETP